MRWLVAHVVLRNLTPAVDRRSFLDGDIAREVGIASAPVDSPWTEPETAVARV
jgi:hypothetical protein